MCGEVALVVVSVVVSVVAAKSRTGYSKSITQSVTRSITHRENGWRLSNGERHLESDYQSLIGVNWLELK